MSSATLVCSRRCGSPASARRSSGPGDGTRRRRRSGMSAGGVGRRESSTAAAGSSGLPLDPVGALKRLGCRGGDHDRGRQRPNRRGRHDRWRHRWRRYDAGRFRDAGGFLRTRRTIVATQPLDRRARQFVGVAMLFRCGRGLGSRGGSGRGDDGAAATAGVDGGTGAVTDLAISLFARRSRLVTTGFGRDARGLRRLVGGFFRGLFDHRRLFGGGLLDAWPFRKCPWP